MNTKTTAYRLRFFGTGTPRIPFARSLAACTLLIISCGSPIALMSGKVFRAILARALSVLLV